jgi:hypothetical protein
MHQSAEASREDASLATCYVNVRNWHLLDEGRISAKARLADLHLIRSSSLVDPFVWTGRASQEPLEMVRLVLR